MNLNWPIEPIQVILTKINDKNFTTTDMNSAYNQMPLDKQSRRLTQFVIGNQQYEFNRLFYGISIRPAPFSAFMSKIFRQLILKIINHILRRCLYAILNKRRNVHCLRKISSKIFARKHESSLG